MSTSGKRCCREIPTDVFWLLIATIRSEYEYEYDICISTKRCSLDPNSCLLFTIIEECSRNETCMTHDSFKFEKLYSYSSSGLSVLDNPCLHGLPGSTKFGQFLYFLLHTLIFYFMFFRLLYLSLSAVRICRSVYFFFTSNLLLIQVYLRYGNSQRLIAVVLPVYKLSTKFPYILIRVTSLRTFIPYHN